MQGVAGGLLAGLGYAVINSALPRWLWTRGSALVSAMWGVATVVGPATGGLFAQLGIWRWAFVVMAVLTALMALLVPVALARVDPAPAIPRMKVPVWSLLIIGVAALAVSVAQIPHNTAATFGLLAAGIMLVGLFVIVDWRMHAAILPPSVFSPGPLKWIYLTMGVLMAAAMVNTYVPLFGQRLAHLTPIAAGFLGAALALGWTVSEIVSASLENPRTVGRVVMVAPLVAASGLALGAVARHGEDRRAVGGGAAGRRHGHRDGLAASVGAGHGVGQRPGRGRRRFGGDQHRPADLRRDRRRVGRRRRQHRHRG